jgi:hypothetical protein
VTCRFGGRRYTNPRLIDVESALDLLPALSIGLLDEAHTNG